MDASGLLTLASAILAGLLFGYCAQRGGFCLTRALSNWALASVRSPLASTAAILAHRPRPCLSVR